MPIYISAKKIKPLFIGQARIKSVYVGSTKVYDGRVPFATPTISVSGNTLTTEKVANVTSYKVYDNNVYIGYVDAGNVWHSA